MSPATPAERKAAERERKRAQGLVLKQVWVTPEAWPIISDLATQDSEAEQFRVYTEGGATDGLGDYPDGTPVSLTYDVASEIANEILAQGEVLLGRDRSPDFLRNVIRVMLKTYEPLRRAHPETVRSIRKDLE